MKFGYEQPWDDNGFLLGDDGYNHYDATNIRSPPNFPNFQ